MIRDVAVERALLAGVLNYGKDVFYDVDDVVNSNCFTEELNQVIYKSIKYAFEQNADAELDVATVMSAANQLKMDSELKKPTGQKYLSSIFQFPIKAENVRSMGVRLKKLQLARQLLYKLQLAETELQSITGAESVESIISIPEKALFEFSGQLTGTESSIVKLGEDALEFVEHLANNPREIIGISSGIPSYDHFSGGGFRRGNTSLVAARTKTGKSQLSLAVGLYVTKTLGIPVLYLDTEMSKESQTIRALANLSGVTVDCIEKGQFGKNPFAKNKTKEAAETLGSIPLYYANIAGQNIEETLSMCRRWLHKTVGVDANGRRKDCLIIYDYLKLMDSEELETIAEWQALGFLLMKINNFMIKYDAACLALGQLNKDGIDNVSIKAIAGSDRLSHYASTISMLKPKSEEEIVADNGNGNLKLHILLTRYGIGMPPTQYINIRFRGELSRMEEVSLEEDFSETTDGDIPAL